MTKPRQRRPQWQRDLLELLERGPGWVPRYFWERLVLGVVLLTLVLIWQGVAAVWRWLAGV